MEFPRFFQANLNEIPNISLFSTLLFISFYRNLKKKEKSSKQFLQVFITRPRYIYI